MKIVLREHKEIVSVAGHDTAPLTGSLIKHLLIFRAGQADLSDMNSVDTFGSQDNGNFIT